MKKQAFLDLVSYALTCLTTPTSNAVVERIFSCITNVKTRQRNRMSRRILEAIFRIRTNLQFGEKCCTEFVTTERMLNRFNSEVMYGSKLSNNEDNDEIAIIETY